MSDGLRVRGLRARYPRGPEVLDGVDFDARRGQVTALLGPNGSGKSTVLKAVLGLVESDGELELDGEDLRARPSTERARRIAYVPQRTRLVADMPVRAVVELGRFVHRGLFERPSPRDRAAVDRALAETETVELAARPFLELSGGEQQRVLLARALASGARTLLLDEPTSSQDVRHALDLHAVLRGLASRGRAIVVVLHDLNEARAHANRAVLLRGGTVHSSGPVRAATDRDPVRAVYGIDTVEGGGLGFRRIPAGREAVP